jgi:TPR repeat protein
MSEAVTWYAKAAENGSAEAASRLARMYLGGLGVPLNEREGKKWYMRAIKLGYSWT